VFSRAKLGFMEIYSLLVCSCEMRVLKLLVLGCVCFYRLGCGFQVGLAGGSIQEEHRLGFTPRSQFASGFQFSPGGLGGACASFTQKEWDPDP
jgi:hypothetical protein